MPPQRADTDGCDSALEALRRRAASRFKNPPSAAQNSMKMHFKYSASLNVAG